MADIRLSLEWTCGMKIELHRSAGMVGARLPHKSFSIEPAKATLVAKLLAALAEYPESATGSDAEAA